MATQSQTETKTRINVTVSPLHSRKLQQIAEHLRFRPGRTVEECIDITHKSLKLSEPQ